MLSVQHSVLNVKALVWAFKQEKALCLTFVSSSSGHPHLLPDPGQEPGAGVGVEPRQVAVEGPEQLRGGAEQDGEGERGLAAYCVAQLAAHRAARTQAEDVEHLHRAHGRLLQARTM